MNTNSLGAQLSQIQALNQSSFQSLGENVEDAQLGLEMALKTGHPPAIAESHFVVGHCQISRGRTVDAAPHLLQAEKMFKEMPHDRTLQRHSSSLQIALARLHDERRAYSRALEHSKNALSIAQSNESPFEQQRALLFLGYAYAKIGHGEQAIDYMMDGLCHPAASSILIMGANDYIADLLEQQHLWAVALRLRRRALTFAEPAARLRRGRVLCGIARCQLNLGQVNEAWESLKRAEEEVVPSNVKSRVLGKIYEGWARHYLCLREIDNAWLYHRKMEEVFDDCGSIQFADDAALLKAEIELEDGRFDSCEKTFEQLQGLDLSFDRRLALDSLMERHARESLNWSKAYQIHLSVEARRRTDLGVVLERKELEHRHESEKLQNARLAEKDLRLDRGSEERDDMMHFVVHDVANYLQVSRSSIEAAQKLIETRILEGAAGGGAMLVHSLKSLDRMEELLGQLRLLWQVKSSLREGSATESVPICDIVNEVVSQFLPLAIRKGQTLQVEQRVTGLFVSANQVHLNQILANLISNAIKFSSAGATTTVCICKVPNRPQVEIRVCDQGPGMSADDLSQAFQRFRRLSARPTAGEPSSGLGLYLVKCMVEASNGNISANSAGEGKGSVFTVKFNAQTE